MENLATTNQNDFIVLENGEAYASQRVVAQMCGVSQQAISAFCLSNNLDVKQGVSPKKLQLLVSNYAQKGKPEAISSLGIMAEAGAKAFIYHGAGLTIKTEIKISPLDALQNTIDILRNQEKTLDNHEDRLKNLEDYKRPGNKKGCYTCSKGYWTVGEIEKELRNVKKPLANTILRKFFEFYFSELKMQGEHCYEKNSVAVLLIRIFDTAVINGAFMQDPNSGFKFKANWLIKQIEEAK